MAWLRLLMRPFLPIKGAAALNKPA